MPRIEIIRAPHVPKKEFMLVARKLGNALITDIEKAFGLEGESDVVVSIPKPLDLVIGESDIQVEVSYTEDEEFKPNKDAKENAKEMMRETLLSMLSGIVKTFSIWIKPVKESIFAEIQMYPEGYVSIVSAPEGAEIKVIWGTKKFEFGKAIRMGNQWYNQSNPGSINNGHACLKPVAWHPKM